MFVRTTLRRSAEFERIRALPRRTWTAEQMSYCAAYYTKELRTAAGSMSLRPIQSIALHELKQCGGLLGPIRVGGGKTLLSLLAPRVLRAVRPVLLLPAALVEKTRREMGHLMLHWQIPRNIQIQSYEMLGRESAANFFQIAKPDLIVADEAHRLKNARAGVTRRVRRYMAECPATRFVAISGTILKDDLADFGHLAEWCLKGGAPVPLESGELAEWSDCLATQANPLKQVSPGPLVSLAWPADIVRDDVLATARKAFRRRMLETPGVISSGDESVACSLYVRSIWVPANDATESNFRKLRNDWETPDGWALTQAVDVWRHARELALGFHYVWDPRPPEEWLSARRAWASFVRTVLARSRTLDTELQVSKACIARDLPADDWNNWARVRDSFIVHSKAIWHDSTALDLCAKWTKEGPGIIWTEHAFFGRELAARTGLQYYGEQGVNDAGQPIESANPAHSVIASARANSTGRNLQAWARNLITAPPAGAPAWEQMIGRTDRDGQKADTVTVDFLLGCREHFDAFDRAITAARATEQTIGHSQKLLLADVAIPDIGEVRERAGSSQRWVRNAGRDDAD